MDRRYTNRKSTVEGLEASLEGRAYPEIFRNIIKIARKYTMQKCSSQ